MSHPRLLLLIWLNPFYFLDVKETSILTLYSSRLSRYLFNKMSCGKRVLRVHRSQGTGLFRPLST